MSQKIAILDLGTNTFHLFIVTVNKYAGRSELVEDRLHKEPQHLPKYEILFKEEKFVGLAEEGIGHIGDKAFARAIQQLKEYKKVIDQHQPEKIFAFGTAALRNADNADDLIQRAFEETGIEIKKISGDEEAELICDGVRQAISLTEDPALIMDIGGGSTEFIIANAKEIFWKQSFPVGASVLKQKFHHTEPIIDSEKNELTNFLEQELSHLFAQQKKYSIHHLIGASGSFDSFASMIKMTKQNTGVPAALEEDSAVNRTSLSKQGLPQETLRLQEEETHFDETYFEMKEEELKSVFSELERKNLQERLQIRGLLQFRAPMIVMASILTEIIIHHFSINRISQSSYALKEGVLSRIALKAEG